LRFPTPTRIEVIVVRDGCEQTFSIDINDDTVVSIPSDEIDPEIVDPNFQNDAVELREPILVPPCPEEAEGG